MEKCKVIAVTNQKGGIGKPMVLHRASTMKKARYSFTCCTYGKRGKGACSRNHIREDELYKIVLDDLRGVTHFARMKERQFAACINQKNSKELRQKINMHWKELDSMGKRDGELSMQFKRLYEDHMLQRITAGQFRMLSADYNAEQQSMWRRPQKSTESGVRIFALNMISLALFPWKNCAGRKQADPQGRPKTNLTAL